MNEKKVEELAAKYADSVHPIQKPDWDDVFHWDDLCEAFKSDYAAAQQSGDGYLIQKGDEVNSLLSVIMRVLDDEQKAILLDKLSRRTPPSNP